MKTIRTILTIIFALGGMMVFNESDSYIPNLIALGCWAMVIVLNADKATIDKMQR